MTRSPKRNSTLPNKKPVAMRFEAKKNKLSFGQGNAKLHVSIATFSLPAGHTCPFARECLSKANRLTGKIIDGNHCKFRCFAASQECTYRNVRTSRWRNYELLRAAGSVERMARLIHRSLPPKSSAVRIHVSGDYFTERYFLAWLNVAYNNPTMNFYGYTKATPFIVKYRNVLPPNFRLTASKGGTCDQLIPKFDLKFAEVVFSEEEAEQKGLEIDHDDSLAYAGTKSLALLIHGTQPTNSAAGRAWRKLVNSGVGGYGKGTRKMAKATRKFEIVIPFTTKQLGAAPRRLSIKSTSPAAFLFNIKSRYAAK